MSTRCCVLILFIVSLINFETNLRVSQIYFEMEILKNGVYFLLLISEECSGKSYRYFLLPKENKGLHDGFKDYH